MFMLSSQRQCLCVQGPLTQVVDSGAAESVCPCDWSTELPTEEVAWNQRRRIKHHREEVCCEVNPGPRWCARV